MSKLKDYRLLCFDVYGTLIDWETGVIAGLEPLTSQLPKDKRPTRNEILHIYHSFEKDQQVKTPDMPYSQLLATIYPMIASKMGVNEPKAQDAETFGSTVGKWPAFPDTVDALKRLSRFFKLVVLSNVDKESFSASNAGPLGGVKLDRIITAQEIGSYKPDLKNFDYMLNTVKEEFGITKDQVLQTAQSQFHDHYPAKKVGIKSVWIERGGTMGNMEEVIFDWKFQTLGEMADAVEGES